MGTLLELKTRIATDLTRDDLTSQIASAVTDAIAFYARERFWFNSSRNLTFTTVPGQIAYGAADLAGIPTLLRIDAMFLPQNQSILPLDRYEPVDFELLNNATTGGGRPTAFTYVDQAIRLWPTPNAAFVMRLHAHLRLPAAADGDTNAWTDDAEELIRSHAKLLLYLDLLEDDQGATRMQSKIPLLLNALRAETSARLSAGVIKGTEF
ncbi:hypothetical protein [Bradyrhizobium prioriisuperbiae]|uniref:phage adaptor protein n=1 Tax=Bradyrhizobium prioriisuperbiae TaxID=2854389 RepID=UPI0028E23551|nr:hypothetical protein [Bradyrhizobium prioritasuperba]